MVTQISTGWRAVTFHNFKTLLRHWDSRRARRGGAGQRTLSVKPHVDASGTK